MSEMFKNVTSACKVDDPAKATRNPTYSLEEVAGPEISARYVEMFTLQKVMGTNTAAVSTHSVSEMRQINMAGNI